MIYFVFFASAIVTGVLFALAVRVTMGIEHAAVLAAIGVIGGGLQMIALIAWYLSYTRPVERDSSSEDTLSSH